MVQLDLETLQFLNHR